MKYPDETKEWFSGHRCVRLSDTRGLFCKANRGGHYPRHKIAWPFASAPQLSEPESRSGDGSPRVLARYSLPDPVWPYYSPVWSRSLRS